MSMRNNSQMSGAEKGAYPLPGCVEHEEGGNEQQQARELHQPVIDVSRQVSNTGQDQRQDHLAADEKQVKDEDE